MEFELHPQLAKDTFLVGDLKLCRLLLMNDRNFPWLILVPRRTNLREIYELGRDDQVSFMIESNLIARLLTSVFKAEKLNIAALGNQVSQLHIHHIARYKNDACWPKPVWGQQAPQFYTEAEKAEVLGRIREHLGRNLQLTAEKPSKLS